MKNRTRKEFAEYLKMDVKSLADKIRYQEKKAGKVFGQDFTDTKIYTEQEQLEICELLEIPVFRTVIHGELTKDILSEKQSEQLKKQIAQLSDLFSIVENVNFVKLDPNFKDNLIDKLGRDFAYWYSRKHNQDKFRDYEWDFVKFSEVAEYYKELENKEL